MVDGILVHSIFNYYIAWIVSGDQFMTYNVHQLLHLKSDVENLGPLWTHSCFFFEDLNGDFRDLFHGTQNINGQVRIIKNNKYFLEVI